MRERERESNLVANGSFFTVSATLVSLSLVTHTKNNKNHMQVLWDRSQHGQLTPVA